MRRGHIPGEPRHDTDETEVWAEDFPKSRNDARVQRAYHQRMRSTPAAGLSARDEAMLQAIARLQFVTSRQIVRLFYQPGSLEYVRGRLKHLADRQYLLRLRLPSSGPGNTAWVYAVAGKGWRYLRASNALSGNEEAPLRFRPTEQHEHSWLFLTHSLAVTDILVAALCLPEIQPTLLLRELCHERVLRRQPPVKVQTLRGETVGIIPDGFLDFILDGEVRMSILLELDRGTMAREAMQRKFRGLLAYADGPYQTVFRSTSLTFAVATTAGLARCEQLRTWCARVLQEVPDATHRQAYADLFLFTALPQTVPGSGALDPEALFLRPVWTQPLADGLQPLLDGVFPMGHSSDEHGATTQ